MRAQRLKQWSLMTGALLTSALLLVACQTDSIVNASPAIFEVQRSSAPEAMQGASGVRLTAHIGQQPYVGEFVITELNGAEVARVVTNQGGQTTVDLPPGKYLLGVRTEEIYPLAAPVTVDVLAHRYMSVEMSLDTGLQHPQAE